MRTVKSLPATRELEILDLICAVTSTRETSAELVLSEDTIRGLTKSILRKPELHSRSDAIAVAALLRQPRTEQPDPRAARAVAVHKPVAAGLKEEEPGEASGRNEAL